MVARVTETAPEKEVRFDADKFAFTLYPVAFESWYFVFLEMDEF